MSRVALLAGLALTVSGASVSAQAGEIAGAYQQHCAACHLPDGAGVPGAYPRLAGRVEAIAATDAGREYLVQVMAKGLVGALVVDDVRMQGVMPPQAMLSEVETALILNALIGFAQASKPFSEAEVAAIRAKHKELPMNAVIGLRPKETGGN